MLYDGYFVLPRSNSATMSIGRFRYKIHMSFEFLSCYATPSMQLRPLHGYRNPSRAADLRRRQVGAPLHPHGRFPLNKARTSQTRSRSRVKIKNLSPNISSKKGCQNLEATLFPINHEPDASCQTHSKNATHLHIRP